jgi:hypothetical protein
MKSAVLEISRISESLPPRKATQLLEYARSLVSKKSKSKSSVNGDAEWERIINDPRPRPKLRARIKEVDQLIATGKTEPMNFDRL